MNRAKGRTLLLREETERELLVRTVPCPVCTSPPGQRCYYVWGSGWASSSHTGRYNVAVEAGLVPKMVGAP